MKKNLLLLLIFLLSLTLYSCSDDDDTIVDPPQPATQGVFVVNEGLYGQNNSSLTYHSLEDNTTSQNVFQSTNNGSKLGDTANDIFIFGNQAYITVDNSNKIEIIDTETFESLGTIDLGSGSNPREVIVLDENTGYVTSLYNQQVIKFNPTTLSITARITVGQNPEGIEEAGGKLFVANSGFGMDNTISVINTATDEVEKTLTVAPNPRIIVEDGNDLYVVCTGLFDETGRGGVYKIDPVSATVTDTVVIDGNPGEAAVVPGNAILVVNSTGIQQVALNTFTLRPNTLISASDVNGIFGVIYSIAYNQTTETIYCGNPKDFQQNGEVVGFDLSGVEQFRFETGINPGCIDVVTNP